MGPSGTERVEKQQWKLISEPGLANMRPESLEIKSKQNGGCSVLLRDMFKTVCFNEFTENSV